MPQHGLTCVKSNRLPRWLGGKESACKTGDVGSIPESGRYPGEGKGNPLPFLPGKSHRQRSLAGYSPCGQKESDMTEQLNNKNKWNKPLTKGQILHSSTYELVGVLVGVVGFFPGTSGEHIPTGEHPRTFEKSMSLAPPRICPKVGPPPWTFYSG